MATRIIAAIVGLGTLIPILIWGGVLGLDIYIAVALLICLDEYARMAFKDDVLPSLAWLVTASTFLVGGTLAAGIEHSLTLLGLVVVGTFVFNVMRISDKAQLKGAADRVGRYLLGITWISGLIVFVPLIRRLDDGLLWLFILMIVPWSSDTGGYFAGRAFGKNKMSPVISPKKTWEGLVGGLALATVAMLVYRHYVFETLTVADCLFLSLGLGAVGVVGDLAESLVKRTFEVKDSGWIMPGHGGLLDRIDALMFVAPLLYAYATLVKTL